MGRPVETKVAAPTVATAVLIGVASALWACARAFGLHLTPDEEKAVRMLGVALIPVVQFVVGFYAPHTPRPDLHVPPAEDAVDAPATARVDVTQTRPRKARTVRKLGPRVTPAPGSSSPLQAPDETSAT
jgi:hypothetical protein